MSKKKKDKQQKGVLMPQLEVISTTGKPRHRAGFVFGAEPLLIGLDTLAEEQARAIYADPMLRTKEINEVSQ